MQSPYTNLSLSSTFICLCLSASLIGAAEINVYSARKEDFIKPLLLRFEESTDTKINLITGKADALLQRLIIEGKNSHADVYVSNTHLTLPTICSV